MAIDGTSAGAGVFEHSLPNEPNARPEEKGHEKIQFLEILFQQQKKCNLVESSCMAFSAELSSQPPTSVSFTAEQIE